MRRYQPIFMGGNPNEFQVACATRIVEVLAKHNIEASPFTFEKGGVSLFKCSFDFQGNKHLVGILEDGVTMNQETKFFELYMRDEFRSAESKITSFAARLDRYLAGGPWDDPAQRDLRDIIKEKLGRIS